MRTLEEQAVFTAENGSKTVLLKELVLALVVGQNTVTIWLSGSAVGFPVRETEVEVRRRIGWAGGPQQKKTLNRRGKS